MPTARLPVEHHTGHVRLGDYLEIGSPADAPQIGLPRAAAPSAAGDGALRRSYALLLLCVHVVIEGDTDLLTGGDERPDQRVGRRNVRHLERPTFTVKFAGSVFVVFRRMK